MKTRIKQLEASAKHLRGCLVSKNHQHKAIYRKSLFYVMQELNSYKEKP